MAEAKHPLSDEDIKDFWPDCDTPESRTQIRAQFDALMDTIKQHPRQKLSRFPELMASVVADKALPISDRICQLEQALADIPAHLLKYQWRASGKAVFGDHHVYGDDGYGTGRQFIASTPADKAYFGSLSTFIAAANPDTISQLLKHIANLEEENMALREKVSLFTLQEPKQ